MKKYIPAMIAAIILLVLVLRSLAGAWDKPYEVYEENNQWYIKADVGIPWEVTGVQYGQEIAYIEFYSYDDVIEWATFPSVTELRSEVSNHGLTVRQLQWLQHFAGGRSVPIPICDLDNLYEPIVPSGLTTSNFSLRGEEYVCDFSGDDYTGQFHIFYNLNDYQKCLSQSFGVIFSKFPEISADEVGADKTTWDIQKESDTLSKLFGFSSTGTQRYLLNIGTDSWYVKQPHIGKDTDEPKTIHMFCQRENVGFWIQIKCKRTTPSVQFLADFGFKPVE